MSVQYPAVCGDGYNLPGNKFPAGFQSTLHRIFDSAAAGNLHADHHHTFDLIACDNLSKLFCVISFIQLRTADQSDTVADEFIVEISVGIGGAVSGHQKVGIVK